MENIFCRFMDKNGPTEGKNVPKSKYNSALQTYNWNENNKQKKTKTT